MTADTAAPRIWTASPGILHLSITLNAEGASTHRLDEDEAHEVAYDLAYRLAKEAYKL